MKFFYLDTEDKSSVKSHHEPPTSDSHKSKINKSTNNPFTGRQVDIQTAPKKIRDSYSYF